MAQHREQRQRGGALLLRAYLTVGDSNRHKRGMKTNVIINMIYKLWHAQHRRRTPLPRASAIISPSKLGIHLLRRKGSIAGDGAAFCVTRSAISAVSRDVRRHGAYRRQQQNASTSSSYRAGRSGGGKIIYREEGGIKGVRLNGRTQHAWRAGGKRLNSMP